MDDLYKLVRYWSVLPNVLVHQYELENTNLE